MKQNSIRRGPMDVSQQYIVIVLKNLWLLVLGGLSIMKFCFAWCKQPTVADSRQPTIADSRQPTIADFRQPTIVDSKQQKFLILDNLQLIILGNL